MAGIQSDVLIPPSPYNNTITECPGLQYRVERLGFEHLHQPWFPGNRIQSAGPGMFRKDTQKPTEAPKGGVDEVRHQNSCRYRSSSHWCT